MSRYVALLRGINVGGKNIIKMTGFRACFERLGVGDVTTYIQSGNVVFSADASARSGAGAPAALTRRIEDALATRFRYQASVVLRSHKQLADAVARAPKGFGADLERYRCDVIFLKEPLTAAEAIKSVRTRDGVDQATAGDDVLYFSRLAEKAAQSLLGKLVAMPVYQRMTIRNWNTTTRLLQMLEAAEA